MANANNIRTIFTVTVRIGAEYDLNSGWSFYDSTKELGTFDTEEAAIAAADAYEMAESEPEFVEVMKWEVEEEDGEEVNRELIDTVYEREYTAPSVKGWYVLWEETGAYQLFNGKRRIDQMWRDLDYYELMARTERGSFRWVPTAAFQTAEEMRAHVADMSIPAECDETGEVLIEENED